jgi:hypothetical protein
MSLQSSPVYDQSDCTLLPGDLIEHSGVYEICHFDENRATVILTRNAIFPYCRRCAERVRYKLIQPVPHISEDPDFREEVSDNPDYLMQVPNKTFPMQLGKAHGFRFQQDVLQTWPGGPEGGDL